MTSRMPGGLEQGESRPTTNKTKPSYTYEERRPEEETTEAQSEKWGLSKSVSGDFRTQAQRQELKGKIQSQGEDGKGRSSDQPVAGGDQPEERMGMQSQSLDRPVAGGDRLEVRQETRPQSLDRSDKTDGDRPKQP